MEGFIRINITNTCQERLIQQQAFQVAFAPRDSFAEFIQCEGVLKGFWTEVRQHFIELFAKVNAPELSSVRKTQFLPIIQGKTHAQPPIKGILLSSGQHVKVSCHLEMNDQRVAGELKQEILGSPVDRFNALSSDSCGELRGTNIGHPSRSGRELFSQDGPPYKWPRPT